MKTMTVTSVFNCMSGNSGLTEEFIYTKIATKGEFYEVLSSATTDVGRLGFIPVCILANGRALRVFEGKHGILVARNGKAGQMTYLTPGKYTINDHAYILSLRDDFKKKEGITAPDGERRFLLWFICTFQSRLYEYASKTANATWNKSGFLKMTIDLPTPEAIDKIAELYEGCLHTMSEVQQILNRLDVLLHKQISSIPEGT